MTTPIGLFAKAFWELSTTIGQSTRVRPKRSNAHETFPKAPSPGLEWESGEWIAMLVVGYS